LKESIKFVNKYTHNINDGLGLSIHCNTGGGEGAETFYFKYNQTSRDIAKKLIDTYCQETGLKNRGAKSDTLTRHKQLGWIRKTNVWSVLIEAGFLDSIYDVNKLRDCEKIARGICKGVNAVYNIPYIEPRNNNEKEPELEENKKSGALVEIIQILKKYKFI